MTAEQKAPGVCMIHPLVGSDTAKGALVYNPMGDKIGRIDCVMVDKTTGRIFSAVLRFNHHLAFEPDSYPLPWSLLTYNPRLSGYEIRIADEHSRSTERAGPSRWPFGKVRLKGSSELMRSALRSHSNSCLLCWLSLVARS